MRFAAQVKGRPLGGALRDNQGGGRISDSRESGVGSAECALAARLGRGREWKPKGLAWVRSNQRIGLEVPQTGSCHPPVILRLLA